MHSDKEEKYLYSAQIKYIIKQESCKLQFIFQNHGLHKYLTAVFFETGAMSTPTKSQNVTNCGSGGSFQS